MATSSITKEFKVKNNDAFNKLVKEVDKIPTRAIKVIQSSSIERGDKLLKQFSFR